MNFEEQLKEEILKSMQRMFTGRTNPLLLKALNFYFPGLDFALLIKSIPEQAEDIFWIMIDLNRIAVLEIPRQSDELADVKNEIIDINAFKQQITSKESRRRFNAAEKLMQLKFKST